MRSPRRPVRVCALCIVLALPLFSQEDNPDLGQLIQSARAKYLKGDYEEARIALDQAWTLAGKTPPEDVRRYQVLKQLADFHAAAGRFAEAEARLQEALNWQENNLGKDNPQIADTMTAIAMLCRRMKDYPRATAILGSLINVHVRAAGGFEGQAVADDFSRLALVHMDEEQPERAAAMLETALRIREKLLGPDHPGLLPELDRMAAIRMLLREYAKAEDVLRRALLMRERAAGPDSPDLIQTVDGLAYACFGQKKHAEAEPLYKRLLELWLRSAGAGHPMVALALDKLATFYREQNRWEEAVAAADRALAIRALFHAEGLAEEGLARLGHADRNDAVRLYRRAAAVLDPERPEHKKLRAEVETNLKALAPAAGKAAPARKASGRR